MTTTRHEANVILAYFRQGSAFHPGTRFDQLLVKAVDVGDWQQKALLARGFPGMVAGVVMARDNKGGIHALREIAALQGNVTPP